MAIELSCLSQLISDEDRTKVMAWYNLVGSFSVAIGSLFCGTLVTMLMSSSYLSLSLEPALQTAMFTYCGVQGLMILTYHLLGPEVECEAAVITDKTVNPVTLFLGLHKSKETVIHLSILFMLDRYLTQY